MRMRIATIAAGFAIALLGSQAHAFCIYNKIDKPFQVHVRSGGSGMDVKTWKSFVKTVKPGGSECCNWKNTDCNHSGKRDAMLTMSDYSTTYNGRRMQCRTFGNSAKQVLSGDNLEEPKIQAGGYATLERNPEFRSGSQVSASNAPYLLKSWSFDDKHTGTKPCSE